MSSSFYKDGLRFECTRCNDCCRHDPGYVFLSPEDVQRLLDGLGMDIADFTANYLRDVTIGPFRRVSLIEKENFDCIFWENSGCTVYEHRPLQCRTFPFWPSCLSDEDSWKRTADGCPGIGKGRLYTEEEIEALVELRKKEPFIELS